MPNDKHSATGKPTAAVPTTSSKTHGQSGMEGTRPGNAFVILRLTYNHGEEPGHDAIDTPSTPHREGVRNANPNSPYAGAHALAIAFKGGRRDEIDKAITDAFEGAEAWFAESNKKSKSTKSKGGAGGGPSRKRDHDTMTNASRLANDSGGGSAAPSSSKNPAHDGDNSVQANKFQRILPKGPGPSQLGPARQEQGYEGLNDSGHSHPNQAVSSGQAAHGENQTPEAAPPVIPFLSGQVLAWLPTNFRVAASSARSYVQAVVNYDEEWYRTNPGNPFAAQLGITKDETVLQEWDTTLRAFLEVATAARDGRQLDHRPILQNKLTDAMEIQLPDPDQPHGDKQFIHEQPIVPANKQPGQIHTASPIIMGMNPMGPGSGQLGDLSGDIDTAMRISSRNESVRQDQIVQLHNLLASQGRAHAQGFQDIQAAHRRADEARERECAFISTLISKRSKLRDKKED